MNKSLILFESLLFVAFLTLTLFRVQKLIENKVGTSVTVEKVGIKKFPSMFICPLDYEIANISVDLNSTFNVEDFYNLPKIQDMVNFSVNSLDNNGYINLNENEDSWTEFAIFKDFFPPHSAVRCARINIPILDTVKATEVTGEFARKYSHRFIITLGDDSSIMLQPDWTEIIYFTFPNSFERGYNLEISQHQKIKNCVEKVEETSFDCIRRFLDNEASCSIPWLYENSTKSKTCQGSDEIRNYFSPTRSNLTISKLKAFGCVLVNETCQKTMWKPKEMFTELYGDSKSNVSRLYIEEYSTEMQIIEEYYIYTFENFVAEIGGYLGLFLGASILSMGQSSVAFIKRFCRRRVRHEEPNF